MKKLLAAGEEKIVDFARVFRNRERGALHAPEFTLVEWYRAGEPYAAVMADCVAVVREAAKAVGAAQLAWRGRSADPFAEPETITVADAFRRHAGIDFAGTGDDRDRFAAAARDCGVRIADDDTWSDIFSRVLTDKVEPHLGIGRLTILHEYPVTEAALARVSPHDAGVAERFELYACGVELANGFAELIDVDEQRRRFVADMDEKQRIYGERYPLDEDFLVALAAMPEASGVALGLDRLVMLADRRQPHRPGAMDAGGGMTMDGTGRNAAPNLPLEGRSKFAERSESGLREGVNPHVAAPSRNRLRSGSPISTSPQGGGSNRAHTLRSLSDLVDAGLIAPERRLALEEVAARYAVAVTPAMAELIDRNDGDDPIARQFVPDPAELVRTAAERDDPIGDDAHQVAPGLIHRYPDRVLLKFTSVCAVYCRFCFRRETVGHGGALSPAEIEAALDYVRGHPEVWEVIVSGGDPLVVTPRRLQALTAALGEIDHVKAVRFHTRVPVVAPERVTPQLIAALKALGKATWVAIHANHPRELTQGARAALARLTAAGIPLVSQTVLLKGVNDDADTLARLMRAFVEAGVKPYYLHQGDLAPGTGRFRTTLTEGRALMKALRGRLSGLCQPTYVVDIPGGHGKAPVGPDSVSDENGACLVEDFSGRRHAYLPEDRSDHPGVSG